MTAPHCPTCTCCDPLEAEAERIKAWCRDNRIPVVAGRLLHLEGVAAALQCSVSTVNRKLAAGELQPTIIFGRRHVDLTELARVICENSNSLAQSGAE